MIIPDGAAMVALGHQIAESLVAGDVVLLHGDLGAGKTTLTQGLAAGLGISGPIQSPTFTLVAEHAVPDAPGGIGTLYHLDLYRLDGPDDLESLGFDQYIAPENAVTVIEWPERAAGWLPPRFVLVRIEYAAGGGREVTIECHAD